MQIDGIPDYVTPARAQFRFMVRTNLLEKSTKSLFIWGHELGVQTVVKKSYNFDTQSYFNAHCLNLVAYPLCTSSKMKHVVKMPDYPSWLTSGADRLVKLLCGVHLSTTKGRGIQLPENSLTRNFN